jgi:hypothetical protein
MLPRAALACALIASAAAGSIAHAERRPVAVINLDPSPQSPAAAEAAKVRTALRDHPRLAPISVPEDVIAIEAPIPDDDAAWLADARLALAQARKALERYDINAMGQAANTGLGKLAAVSPQAAARPYADLLFELGVAELGQGHGSDAEADLLLVHRLAPDKKLADDLLPEIVAAYDKAKEPATKAQIDVHGTGRAWIDGVERGAAPGVFDVASGPHFVQVTGPDRAPAGLRVDAPANGVSVAPVPDAPLSRAQQIYRARAAIASAGDSLARAAAIERFAALVAVKDVVLFGVITEGGNVRITEQTWQEPFGFSAIHAPEDAGLVLDDLAPPLVEPPQPGNNIEGPGQKLVKVGPPVPIEGPAEPPLYAKRWFQGTVGGVIVTAIVTGIVLGTRAGTIGIDAKVDGRPGW